LDFSNLNLQCLNKIPHPFMLMNHKKECHCEATKVRGNRILTSMEWC